MQIQIQIAINLIIMSKEFLHMRSSKSQEFWLPVTDYPRAFCSFPRRIAGSGYKIVPNPPAGTAISSLVTWRHCHRWQRSSASTRIVGHKMGHSSSSESDSSMCRPIHKHPKPVGGENITPSVHANAPVDGHWALSSSPLKIPDLDECLSRASVVDPFVNVDRMADVKESNASVPSVQESGEDGDGASQDVPSLGLPTSSSEVGNTQELLAAQVTLPPDSSSDGETPDTEISCDDALASRPRSTLW